MLVLRRRAQEAIVFEGGLTLTLAEVLDHRAWLSFRAPSLPVPVVLAPLSVTAGAACIGVRGPTEVRREGPVVAVSVAGPEEDAADTVLLVNRAVGESLRFAGMAVAIGSVEQGRAVLETSVEGVAGPIGVSVFSVSGAEVKIGIAAPPDVRVYREEVWLAMRSANQGAAGWSPDDLATLAGSKLSPSAAEPS